MIYNYLISDYVNRENYRLHDTSHKKSELKKIYSDIVKASKESPSYLFSPTKEIQMFALQLKEDSLYLQNTLKNLQKTDASSVFSSRQIRSDNTDALTTVIDTKDYSKLPEPFTIDIHKLATKQVNLGNLVYSSTAKFGEGIYQFQIDVEDNSYLFQLRLQGKTPNEEVIGHIVNTINQSSTPIQASKIYQSNGEKVQIKLISDDTGSTDGNPIFTCSDVSHPYGTLGCVEYFNINNMIQEPTNSSFSINGEEKNTIANEFTLNNALHLTLHSPTTSPIHIDYENNAKEIMTEVDTIADTYNRLVHLSYNQGNPPKLALKMQHDLKQIFSQSKSTFEDCGITFDENGYMLINTFVANKAAADGKFQSIFGTKDSLGSKAMVQFKNFSINPMKYIEDKIIVAYPNPQKENFANPYMTSIYSGMLFNSYC